MSALDATSPPASRRPCRGVLFDLHGVLLGHARALPGASAGEVIARLRGRRLRLSFVTNSSSVGAAEIVRMLGQEGIEAREAETISAGRAMALYLREHHPEARLLLIGQPGLRRLIEETGGGASRWAGGDADVVVVGRDPSLSPAKLEEAARAGRRGALLLATSDDPHFLIDGELRAGPGQTLRQVEEAMGVRALVVGKPNPFILERGLGLTREQLRETLVVGDSPQNDVRLGRAVGAMTVLFGTSPDGSEEGPTPDWRIDRLEQILELIGEAP